MVESGDPDPGGGGGGDSAGGTKLVKFSKEERVALATLLTVSGTLFAIATQPVRFVASMLPEAVELIFGEDTRRLLEEPVVFIIETIVVWIGSIVLDFMLSILNLILWFFLGADQSIGLGGGFPGLFDIPFFISVPVTNAVYGLAFDIGGAISGFNENFAGQLEPLGLAAPAVVNLMAVVEIGVVIWVGTIIAQSIDVPFIDPVGFVTAVTAPIRRAFDWLFR